MTGLVVLKLVGGLGAAGLLYACVEVWRARRSWRHDRDALRLTYNDLEKTRGRRDAG